MLTQRSSVEAEVSQSSPPSSPPVQPHRPATSGPTLTADSATATFQGRASYKVERNLLSTLHSRIGNPDVQIALWDGFSVGNSDRCVGRVVIRQPRVLWWLIVDSEMAFGDAYATGDLELEGDLLEVLTELNLGLGRVPRNAGLARQFHSLLLRGSRSRQTLAESKASVHHHYDISNDFYKLWLDEQLVYTCAYYERPQMTLEQAQTAKLDYVCRKLRLQPGEVVAEAGCGWGALALHMARHYGVLVKAYNLSTEQVAFARQRAQAEGLSDRVEFIQDDYRNITGRFDAFVSVGMLEHVGVKNYQTLGSVMGKVLTEQGRGLIHSIGRNFAAPLDAWVEKRIFPGANPASLREMMDLFEDSGFSVLDVENLRLHYARTCADWLERFNRAEAQVRQMFDERFVRMWRLYLAGSSATFASGWFQLFQIVFNRATCNDMPITRTDWYAGR